MASGVSALIMAAYRALPPSLRYTLKKSIGLNGHATSYLDKVKADRDAAGKKRLDQSLETILGALRKAGVSSLEGQRALDFGAGFVPSDSIACLLLGAREVVALDYNPIARMDALAAAVAAAPRSRLIEMLNSHVGDARLEARCHAVLDAAASGDWAGAGFTYLAPHDVMAAPLPGVFDLIWSTSVMEHIDEAIAGDMLARLATALSCDGVMLHAIHLEDHRDFKTAPFGFLAADSDYDPAADCDGRGNRIRVHEWQAIFQHIPETTSQVLESQVRPEGAPPGPLAARFAGNPPELNFCSNVLMETRRI